MPHHLDAATGPYGHDGARTHPARHEPVGQRVGPRVQLCVGQLAGPRTPRRAPAASGGPARRRARARSGGRRLPGARRRRFHSSVTCRRSSAVISGSPSRVRSASEDIAASSTSRCADIRSTVERSNRSVLYSTRQDKSPSRSSKSRPRSNLAVSSGTGISSARSPADASGLRALAGSPPPGTAACGWGPAPAAAPRPAARTAGPGGRAPPGRCARTRPGARATVVAGRGRRAAPGC